MSTNLKTVAIIGAGAGGIMATATILEKNPNLKNPKNTKVLIFDRNSKIGLKVSISGGGRCNVTTGITDLKQLLKNYPRNKEFLKYIFKKFGPKKVIQWFEERGIPLKTESDFRVFPTTDKSSSVLQVFENIFAQNSNCEMHLRETVLQLDRQDNKFLITTNQGTYQADFVVLATGGNAYAHTGSKGDGYKFITKFQHTLTEMGPSLNSFTIEETPWITELSGLALPQATLSYKDTKIQGPVLLTHFGISGPATFAFAANIPFELLPISINLKIQPKPLSELIQEHPKKTISNILDLVMPERLATALLKQSKIQSNQKASELSKSDLHQLENIQIPLKMRRPGDEFVVSGGVQLEEINKKTMESKLQDNLYIVGELLDLDGYTGGFNLQIAWSTGRLAGLAIHSKLN